MENLKKENQNKGPEKQPKFCPYCGTQKAKIPVSRMFDCKYVVGNKYQTTCRNCGRNYLIEE